MFDKKREIINGEEATVIENCGYYSVYDTFECGQCFRAEKIKDESGYVEYATVVGNKILKVGQKKPGELFIFGFTDEEIESVVIPYLSLDRDYEKIRADINANTDSDWLIKAGEASRGIAILRQDPWEALMSFIISQNNNIPRIKGIVRKISLAYGECIAIKNKLQKCPFNKINTTPCEEICKNCGACYTFPSPDDVFKNPEKMLSSNPGFRYKYLCDAAEKIALGTVNLSEIKRMGKYESTLEGLKQIKGVGDKVASCVALFAFENLEAFPIDVWIKRAIDVYFDGKLDYIKLGKYAGIAQQFLFYNERYIIQL